MDAAWNTLQTLTTTKKTKDQFDAFGQYIAEKLRQLDSETCIHVKKTINDVIFEAELGNYRSFQHQQRSNLHLPSWISTLQTSPQSSPTSFMSQPSSSSFMSQPSPSSFISQPSPSTFIDYQPPSNLSQISQSPMYNSLEILGLTTTPVEHQTDSNNKRQT